VLKKAGIVVAAAAAGLLAVSPLAFADTDQHGHININDITRQLPTQTCDQHLGEGDGAFANGLGSSAKDKQVNNGDCDQHNSSDN
jgi:hypothetical protein